VKRPRHSGPVDEGEVRGVAVLVDPGAALGLVVADEKPLAVWPTGRSETARPSEPLMSSTPTPRTRKVPSERFSEVVEYTAYRSSPWLETIT
jgi:hypothetical protein